MHAWFVCVGSPLAIYLLATIARMRAKKDLQEVLSMTDCLGNAEKKGRLVVDASFYAGFTKVVTVVALIYAISMAALLLLQ